MSIDSSDDYYALLGVDPKVDEAALRRAWRKLALRWHPDRAGPSFTAMFQTISAAYTVLSDPSARAAYDRRRGLPPRSEAQAPSAPPVDSRRRAPGVLLRRLTGSLNALLACGVARHAEVGVIELLLNAKEASQGGMVTISMRVPVHCRACAGKPPGPCAKCGMTRTVEEPFSAWLAVPPGAADGTVLIPSAMLPGMLQPVSFRVRLPSAASRGAPA